jgi:hypothetical protein
MNGSKVDFLEGEDEHSIASSYSSINGYSLHRNNSDLNKPVNISKKFD